MIQLKPFFFIEGTSFYTSIHTNTLQIETGYFLWKIFNKVFWINSLQN